MFYNSLLADKKPYFFIYKYNKLYKELKDYNKKNNENSIIRFGKTLEDLIKQYTNDKKSINEKEEEFLYYYYKFLPVLDSNSVMNKICHYIESVDFELKKKVKTNNNFNWKDLVTENFQPEKNLLKQLEQVIEEEMQLKHLDLKILKKENPELVKRNGTTKREELDKDNWIILLKSKLQEVCSNEERLSNHLVYIFYCEKKTLNKSVLWSLVGRQIYKIIKDKSNIFYFPIKNENGSLNFLYENYNIEKLYVKEIDEYKNN